MKKSSLLTAGVALLAGVIAFVAIRSFLEPKAPPANEIAPLPGAAATASAAGGSPSVARQIPETLPDFTLATLEGPPKAISAFTQPSLVVNFWATWCAPCRREIPLLRQIRAERGAKGVEVVGVAVDFREDVVKYAAEIGLDYPLLIGEEDGMAAADSFGVDPVFPFTAFVDRERRIIALKIGELHADEAAFILDHVDKVNAGSLQPNAARQLIREEIRRLDALRPKEPA
ncbi:MAG: TlpA family protein disulfide reductase [Gammaproteobacteria bacterium]|jgi:thiol-disulfide isomerase/thioredoxin|nr:TlpA family protein disulfide reductase [Gammaproteobacteria bacterium]